MNIRPLLDRVVVRPAEKEKVSPGGIVIPDTAQKKTQKGTVVAVGPGVRSSDGSLIPVEVKEGDTVLFSAYGGNEIKLDEDILILRSADIFAVIPPG